MSREKKKYKFIYKIASGIEYQKVRTTYTKLTSNFTGLQYIKHNRLNFVVTVLSAPFLRKRKNVQELTGTYQLLSCYTVF